MKSISAYEAKTHLSQFLERVRHGEQFIITKHNVPIATLQPLLPINRHNIPFVIEEIKEFSQKHQLKGLSINEMREEGRA